MLSQPAVRLTLYPSYPVNSTRFRFDERRDLRYNTEYSGKNDFDMIEMYDLEYVIDEKNESIRQ